MTVLVDNKDYVPISKLKEPESGELNLTTMMPDQDRATIELYLRGGRYLEPLHTFELTGLHGKPERPRIVVSAHVRGTLNVTLRVDGELIESKSFPVPEEVHRVNWAPWLWSAMITLLLAAVTIVGVLYLPDLMARDATEVGPSTAEIEQPETRDEFERTVEPKVAPEPRGPVGTVAVDSVDPELPSNLIEQPLYFEPESAGLLPETREQIDAIAAAIAEAAPESMQVRIVGHTALFGTQGARTELSLRRAQNVANALAERLERSGVAGVELLPEGLGGAEPVTRDGADQWRNRRVVLSLEEP